MSVRKTHTRKPRLTTEGPLGVALSILLMSIGIATATLLSGCEFENLKDQEYGPVDPGGNPTDTTGTDTTVARISVAVTPSNVTVRAGETAQFTAVVSGTTNNGVSWLVVSGPGTIDNNGRYSSPGSISTAAEVATVKAVSNADATASATAIVVITPQTTGGGGGGDTAKGTEICFQRDVLPIFQSNCAKSGCHDVTTRRKGYAFVDYNGIMRGIDAGRPENSEIYEKITESDSDDRMPPPPNPGLTSEQIATIRQWILEGARNTICPPATNDCDTGSVSYSGTIRPVLDKYCIGCHSGSNPPKGINLTQYDHVRTTALDGRLRGVTAHLPGFTPMPYGGNKLPDCEIKQIGAWINQGATNN